MILCVLLDAYISLGINKASILILSNLILCNLEPSGENPIVGPNNHQFLKTLATHMHTTQ